MEEETAMKTLDLYAQLRETAYPGRGIVVGMTPSGKKAAIAYFIMGRSANSRNRIFAQTDDGIETRAADPAKLEDPSLIIYHPVRTLGSQHIVTNGDQTDTVWKALPKGESFEDALRTRAFEPDAPNWTPRISAMVNVDGTATTYQMSILKAGDAEGTTCRRYFFDYQPLKGVGHFIHTYQGDGNPLPTFEGEPEQVAIPENCEEFADLIWNNLNEDNKVSLFVRFIDLATNETEDVIVNKFDEVL